MTSASTSVGAREKDRQEEIERRNGKRNEIRASMIENGGVSQVRPGCNGGTALLERAASDSQDSESIQRWVGELKGRNK